MRINVSERQSVKISKESIKDIMDLADKTITNGDTHGNIWLDGYCCEVYYKGFSHKIYTMDEGYDDLYELLNKITESLENSIELSNMI